METTRFSIFTPSLFFFFFFSHSRNSVQRVPSQLSPNSRDYQFLAASLLSPSERRSKGCTSNHTRRSPGRQLIRGQLRPPLAKSTKNTYLALPQKLTTTPAFVDSTPLSKKRMAATLTPSFKGRRLFALTLRGEKSSRTYPGPIALVWWSTTLAVMPAA